MDTLLSSIMVIASSVVATTDGTEPGRDIATLLMRSTFYVSGTSTGGTAFILCHPINGEGSDPQFVSTLVTAHHVLDKISEDFMSIEWRRETSTGYERQLEKCAIRSNGKPLWVKHPTADIAAMHVVVPPGVDIGLVSTAVLATDENLIKYEVKPSDQLFVLGFPHAQGLGGFPVLRTGAIASFPIVPTKKYPLMVFDFRVFPGNSGGPVFMRSEMRYYEGSFHPNIVQFIVGLVSERSNPEVAVEDDLGNVTVQRQDLQLGIVIQAPLILQTIEMLPEIKLAPSPTP